MPGDTEGTKLVMALLRGKVEEAGVEVRYETGVSQLVTDGSGAVVGVAWRSFDETGYLRTGAVVLATGGFVMNPDMVAARTPALGAKLCTLGSTYDDGLGGTRREFHRVAGETGPSPLNFQRGSVRFTGYPVNLARP